MDLFDIVNNLYTKKFGIPHQSQLSGKLWMVNRFISMEDSLVEAIAEVTKYLYTLKNQYYILLYRLIPQVKAIRNKYLKPKIFEESELISRYSRFFMVSKRETIDYIKILREKVDEKSLYGFVGLEKEKQEDK